MRSYWRTWKGVEILHLDYAGFKSDFDALHAEVAEADRTILAQRPGSVLVLIDLRDTIASPAVVQMFRERAPATAPYIRNYALLGITGIKRFLADRIARLIGRPMRLFEAEEAALDWLVGEALSGAPVSDDGEDVVGPRPGDGA